MYVNLTQTSAFMSLLREYKTPVPHLKADKRISSTRKDNYAHISHSNIKKKKKFIHPCNIFLLKCPQLTW